MVGVVADSIHWRGVEGCAHVCCGGIFVGITRCGIGTTAVDSDLDERCEGRQLERPQQLGYELQAWAIADAKAAPRKCIELRRTTRGTVNCGLLASGEGRKR